MAPETPLRVSAHGKLNLGLSVLGKRADGFHEIDTVFARLELHDELWVQRAPRLSGEILEVAEPGWQLRMDEENLVMRAARAYLEAAGENRGVRIGLHKRIPVAAGLGGGSADAAATLLGLSWLYPHGVDLFERALELGSDVPFFLRGYPAARGRGRGERLEPVYLPPVQVVMANPGLAVSAGEAYRFLSRPDGEPLDPGRLAIRLSEGGEPGYRNDLEPGVVEAFPLVGEVLEELRKAGLRGVAMSGSGSTCFGLAADAGTARKVATRLREVRPEWWFWSGTAGG